MNPIDEALSRAVRSGVAPGVVALTADRDGVTYAGAFGARGVDDPAPMSLDTIFWFASMTKAVTSVAALQLVERGRLELDAPVGALLPGLAAPRVLTGFDPGGAPITRPAKTAITLRHLLTHTAGFGYDFMNADMLRARGPGGPPPAGSLDALIAPLLFEPGERWEYGVSTDWLGLAVEAASGVRLDAYLAEHILGPLGMTDTGFALSSAQEARRAPMHARTPQGGTIAVASPGPAMAGWEVLSGGGGLSGTGGDYLRFLRMFLNGGILDGARIVSAETVAAMSTNQIGALRAGALTTAMPELTRPFDLFPDMSPGWSLGFLINPEPAPGGRSAGSLAWAGLGNTHYWIDRKSGVAGVVLTQVLPFGDEQIMSTLRDFERAVYANLEG